MLKPLLSNNNNSLTMLSPQLEHVLIFPFINKSLGKIINFPCFYFLISSHSSCYCIHLADVTRILWTSIPKGTPISLFHYTSLQHLTPSLASSSFQNIPRFPRLKPSKDSLPCNISLCLHRMAQKPFFTSSRAFYGPHPTELQGIWRILFSGEGSPLNYKYLLTF